MEKTRLQQAGQGSHTDTDWVTQTAFYLSVFFAPYRGSFEGWDDFSPLFA
jgi:hypothetical protein